MFIPFMFFFYTISYYYFANRCPSASLDFVVEPWFLGAGATGPGGDDFAKWQKEASAKYGTQFFSSLKDLPKPQQPRLALISGRTADNPHLLEESIATGCTAIYLEKPGAPTVAELDSMAKQAKAANVPVAQQNILVSCFGYYNHS
jgi:hypothetical protein